MRLWKGNSNDDGSIHCLGNGKLALYEKGPNIIQLFGPPYSSPSIIKIWICEDECTEVHSEREQGTAVWKHSLIKDGVYFGEIIDFVDSELPCLVRKIKVSQPISFRLEVNNDGYILDNSSNYTGMGAVGGFLITSNPGTFVFGKYPCPVDMCHQIVIKGNAGVSYQKENKTILVKYDKGEGTFYACGGPSYPECTINAAKALNTHVEVQMERTRKWWKDFTKKRYDFETILPNNLPLKGTLIKTIDDISVLIKTQQAVEGGVLAGHQYLWAALRDQYGVFRCLMKLGYFDEAKAILDYYWNVWKKRGCLHNGQDIGLNGFFHIHENDEVEITGYLLVQAFDYYQEVKDDHYIGKIFPMLEWGWNVQIRHLAKFMLPFNGDETYVAGGILPRSALNDGSAEATLLFITGGERFLNWIEDHHYWSNDKTGENTELLLKVVTHFRDNFWEDGILLTNNPERKKDVVLPEFRHGVCEGINLEELFKNYEELLKYDDHVKFYLFGWTQKNKNDRYLCPLCMASGRELPSSDEKFYLQSVALMPLYIHSGILSKDEIAVTANKIIENYHNTGKLPSRPNGNKSVGYDYGLLLYTLTELCHPSAYELYDKILSLVDSTGAWVEYYEDGKPMGCRYRPWESGINLEALIHFARGFSSF